MNTIMKENISKSTIQKWLAELEARVNSLSLEGVDLQYVNSTIDALVEPKFLIYDSKINEVITNTVDLTAKYNFIDRELTNVKNAIERINIEDVKQEMDAINSVLSVLETDIEFYKISTNNRLDILESKLDMIDNPVRIEDVEILINAMKELIMTDVDQNKADIEDNRLNIVMMLSDNLLQDGLIDEVETKIDEAYAVVQDAVDASNALALVVSDLSEEISGLDLEVERFQDTVDGIEALANVAVDKSADAIIRVEEIEELLSNLPESPEGMAITVATHTMDIQEIREEIETIKQDMTTLNSYVEETTGAINSKMETEIIPLVNNNESDIIGIKQKYILTNSNVNSLSAEIIRINELIGERIEELEFVPEGVIRQDTFLRKYINKEGVRRIKGSKIRNDVFASTSMFATFNISERPTGKYDRYMRDLLLSEEFAKYRDTKISYVITEEVYTSEVRLYLIEEQEGSAFKYVSSPKGPSNIVISTSVKRWILSEDGTFENRDLKTIETHPSIGGSSGNQIPEETLMNYNGIRHDGLRIIKDYMKHPDGTGVAVLNNFLGWDDEFSNTGI